MVHDTPAISVKNLNKDFNGYEALRDISVDIPSGTTTCIVGPSGSGKSTFLRCLNWLEEPSSGTILIDGKPMGLPKDKQGKGPAARRALAKARTEISMVFQQFALWPHLTVLDNIMEAPVHVLHRPRAEVKQEALQLLKRVGLGDKADVYPHTLSGGQKQRVAISRALAMKPKAILFDEPTSALDPEMVAEVLNVIRELAKEGRTMIIVTHEMAFARDIADTIIFIDAGMVREMSPPDVFFNNPKSERAREFISHM
jgi:polar amino acid transport system ATP-binding protein